VAKVTGESVDHMERRTSAAETLLTDAVLDKYVCPHHDIGDTDELPKDAALKRQAVHSTLPHQRVSAAVEQVETEASVELEESLV
jgi:hypothetical protein